MRIILMKQKYQVFQHLQKFFNCSTEDILLTKTKNIGNKRYVYSPGDQINHIYIVVAGQVNLSFQDKQIAIPPNNIVGDFQINRQLNRRTSSLKAKVRAKIIIVPKDFYYKIKQEISSNELFLSKCISTDNQKLLYLITKCFVHKIVMKGQSALTKDAQQQRNIIIIKSGIFSFKKNIGVGIIRKHKIQIQKQFALVNIGEGEIISQNIFCESNKGEIFICKQQQVQDLQCHFPQFKDILTNCSQKKQSLLQRQKSIKKLCIPNCQLYESVLPSVFHSQRKRSKQKMEKQDSSKSKLNTQPSQRLLFTQFEKNHYSIKRQKNNNLFSEQTNSNLSLVPLIKIRKPSIPQTVRIPRAKVIQKFFKNRTQKIEKQKFESISQLKTTTNQLEIPEVFGKKFEKKMFIKPSNPFHHHKGKSLSLDESNNDKRNLHGLRSSENISNVDSKRYRIKKSFLLVSGSLIQ